MQMLAHGVTTGALFILVGRCRNVSTPATCAGWVASGRPAEIRGHTLFFAVASLGVARLGKFRG